MPSIFANDIRKLVIKKELEEALLENGIEEKILEEQEKIILNRFYQDESTLCLLREIIENKELITDIKKIVQEISDDVRRQYKENEELLNLVDSLNKNLIERIEKDEVDRKSLYTKPTNDLLVRKWQVKRKGSRGKFIE